METASGAKIWKKVEKKTAKKQSGDVFLWAAMVKLVQLFIM